MADEILRYAMVKIIEDESLDKYYRAEDKEGLDEFLTKLVFGIGE